MASSTPVPLVVRSSDGSLIGVHHCTNQSSSSSSSSKNAGLIRCYDGNVSNGSLKFTLRVPLLSSLSMAAQATPSLSAGGGETRNALKKIIFAHSITSRDIPSHLCGILQPTPSSSSATFLLVWDLDRGVLAHTIDVRNTAIKKRKRKSIFNAVDGTEVVCDIATRGDQLYALILFPGDDDGGSHSKGKCRLYQYDLAVKEVALVRKIKVGSTSVSSSGSLNCIAVSQASIAVRMGHVIRVLDLATGEKRGKIEFPSVLTSSTYEGEGDGCSLTFAAPLCITSDGKYIITAANNRVVVFSDKDGLKMMALFSTKGDSLISSLDVTVENEGDDKLKLLAFQPFVGMASLFIISAKNQTLERTMAPQMPQAQLHANTKEPSSSPSFIQAMFHPHNPREAMLLLFQYSNKQRGGSAAGSSGINLPMETLSYGSLNGRVVVGTSLSIDDVNTKGDRKQHKSAKSLALAPGDQGQEASMAMDLTLGKKTPKVQQKRDGENEEDVGADSQDLFNLEEDEEHGQSIAERLALLSSAMEQSDDDGDGEDDNQKETIKTDNHKLKFKLKSATSETLSTLLSQALSSNDTVQLNIALQVTDRRLVEGTVRALQFLDAEQGNEQENNSSEERTTMRYISTLMAHIVRRMARRHSLVMPLGVWVRAILAAASRSSNNQVLHGSNGGDIDKRMAEEGRELAMKLGPLKNFLNERVEIFPQLLRLEGRLGLLNPQL